MADKKIDYSAPFIIDTIFKDPPRLDEESGQMIPGTEERVAQLAVLWEDVISIQSYPYNDADIWPQNTGPKFYMTLAHQGTHLCLGKFKEMFNLWKACRVKYFNLESDGQDFRDEG
jgi:hypothetical protein